MREILHHFGHKNPKNDQLTSKFPFNFSLLITWQTTKTTREVLMKLNDNGALPVYPILRGQSHEN